METKERIEKIIRHIRNVQDNCLFLGFKLIEAGKVDFGRQLIANGFVHDNSKFYGMEWLNLDHYVKKRTNKETRLKLSLAVSQHNQTNPHHPEYWAGIENMPEVYLAEMICDWKSRAEEFGTSLMDWIDGGAMERFKYEKDCEVYKKLVYYASLACDQPFQK